MSFVHAKAGKIVGCTVSEDFFVKQVQQVVNLLSASIIGLAFRECQCKVIGEWAVLSNEVDVTVADGVG
jgi:hypothetical protein